MKNNLKQMSTAELEDLQKDIAAELDGRRKQERQKLLDEIRDKAKALGMSIEELVGFGKSRTTRAAKGVAKFAHPDDASLTWSGKGKRPRWVNEWLASGKSLDQLKI